MMLVTPTRQRAARSPRRSIALAATLGVLLLVAVAAVWMLAAPESLTRTIGSVPFGYPLVLVILVVLWAVAVAFARASGSEGRRG